MKNDNQTLKKTIKQFKEELCKGFGKQSNSVTLSRKLAVFIDSLLIQLFNKNKLDNQDQFCLIALGSYGRRELQLHSDIDLLLLHPENTPKSFLQHAQHFIQDCWDVGLEVGHQISTANACAELASQDLTVISTLMDMHLLCGSCALMNELIYKIQTVHMWSSDHYFYAKQQEQKNRYIKYAETAYHLEPNLKYGPGGLRDLQMLLSIGKRHFNIKKLADGILYGFITEKEYEELMYCQHFLWRVRFALHILAGKAQERLSFDYQVKLAQMFAYQDLPHSLAIEQFMKDYFKIIKRNRELNEMLLQWFEETIAHQQKQKIIRLDEEFQLSNQYIEVSHSKVFKDNPHSLLNLFLWIAKRPDIEGVRASTIRLIRESLFLMNEDIRNSSTASNLFMAIFKTEHEPYEALQKMNSYGVLAHYLDCFASVTGQMQYDLFHVYTVDQHTMYVIRNLSRFSQKQFEKQFPLCYQIMPLLENSEILYLSALFHDIAKGRGGDHSELGAIEAEHFAQKHALEKKDSDLLIWLVRHHLIMSQTAQRQDIYDPKTIKQFCQLLPQAYYLDYLYLLTVADICGTNPALWNAWKDSLLKELYRAAKELFLKEQELVDEATLINFRKDQALSILTTYGISSDRILPLWQHFKEKYFLHESPESIAGHTHAILNCTQFPLVMIMPHHSLGGTEVFIYMPHRDERFTIATTVLSNNQVTIQEASISSCSNHYDLDTYIILDEKNQEISDYSKKEAIKNGLVQFLADTKQLPPLAKKRVSSTLAHFNVKTQISFSEEDRLHHTRLFLVTNDRPGLLAKISRVFLDLNIHLHNAKIATAGERVEDMFYISNTNGLQLSSRAKEQLRDQLIKEL